MSVGKNRGNASDDEQRRLAAQYRRQHPPIRMDGPWYCWGCHCQIRSIAEGVSLAGNFDLHCCVKCWGQISIVDRIKLEHQFRGSLAGGIGWRELLEGVNTLLNVAAENGNQQPLDDVGFDASAGYDDE